MLHPDRRLAVRDEANGPVYLIAASFVDYFLIHYSNNLSIWRVWGAWLDFAPNSLLGRSDSLLARINSLLGRVGNSAANYCIRECFSDGTSRKKAESLKFPALFPARREFDTPRDCELDPRPSRQGADRRGT